jgi:GalNAc-alpha-(1->4)-GalNAc-alpha-(1->3)-diNAcBac-PP-undecaprenol alpha-1,4-N-acetyl-D-galactosaminyltransferase
VALGIAGNTQGFREAASANLKRVRYLRKAIIESEPDCVISFMDTINVTTLIASVGTGVPVIITERCYPPMANIRLIWRVLRRLIYPWADTLVAQTEMTKRWFPPHMQRKTKVIPNPIHWEPEVSERSFVPLADRPRIISVGRMEAPKRLDLLIKAFASVVRDRDCELMLVGDGPNWLALQRLTDDLALGTESSSPVSSRTRYHCWNPRISSSSHRRLKVFPARW